MKKRIALSLVLVMVLFLSAFFISHKVCLADDGEEAPSLLQTGLTNAAKESGLETETTMGSMVGKAIGIFLQFLGLVFIVLIVYAGITWMTAGGKEENTKKAKGFMISAVIGLAITLMAYQITSYVIEKIQIK